MNKVIIFSDGASKGNPGPGGYAVIVVENGQVRERAGREENTTNNRMELTAAICGLSTIKDKAESVDIYTDSRYVINGITKWIDNWQKNNWQTKAKEAVLNQDLWEKLAQLNKKFEPKWHYVGGHVGIVGNERVDELASKFASGETVELYEGDLSRYGLDISNFSIDESKAKQKSQSKKSGPAYAYLSLVAGVLYRDKTWAECEKRVKGKSGVKFKKAMSPAEEAEILKEWGI